MNVCHVSHTDNGLTMILCALLLQRKGDCHQVGGAPEEAGLEEDCPQQPARPDGRLHRDGQLRY